MSLVTVLLLLFCIALLCVRVDVDAAAATPTKKDETEKKLEQCENALQRIIKSLKGDRFSAAAYQALTSVTTAPPSSVPTPCLTFISHILLAFLQLHSGVQDARADAMTELQAALYGKDKAAAAEEEEADENKATLAPSPTMVAAIKRFIDFLRHIDTHKIQLLTTEEQQREQQERHRQLSATPKPFPPSPTSSSDAVAASVSASEQRAERVALSLLREIHSLTEPLTPQLEKIDWGWQQLFQVEAKWLLRQVPDHGDCGNRKSVYVPGLMASPWYESTQFRGALVLEKQYDNIMNEVTPFLKSHAPHFFHDVGTVTSAMDANLVVKGKWEDVSLFSAGVRNAEVCGKHLTKLCDLLEKEIPEVTSNVQGHALLSRLSPGTVVNRHHGYSNTQLTMHLGLIVPKALENDPPAADPAVVPDLKKYKMGVEVNGRLGGWRAGRVIAFDDSYYHSVWHNGTVADGHRLVLLLRGYHPEWTLAERSHLLLTHTETPWNLQRRAAEVGKLMKSGMRQKWEKERRRFWGEQVDDSEDEILGLAAAAKRPTTKKGTAGPTRIKEEL